MLVGGKWSDYQVSFTWMHDIEALHLACAFDLKVPERRRSEVQQLIAMINEQLWIGHFDLWTADGMVMFRHSLVLAGGVEATSQQCQALLSSALESCEDSGLPVRDLGRQAASARRRDVRGPARLWPLSSIFGCQRPAKAGHPNGPADRSRYCILLPDRRRRG
jgi:hypothetical protein